MSLEPVSYDQAPGGGGLFRAQKCVNIVNGLRDRTVTISTILGTLDYWLLCFTVF